MKRPPHRSPLQDVLQMRSISIVTLLLLAAPVLAGAQARSRAQSARVVVPPEYRPPAGKCRIWIEGVAPAQQPASTDCQTALRQNPPNGTVIFGPPPKDEDPAAFERRQAPAPAPAPTKVPPRKEPSSDSASPPARRPVPIPPPPTPTPTPVRRPDPTPPAPERRRPDTPPPERRTPDRPPPERPAPDRPNPERPAVERP
jgi:hypothetical protein